MKISTLPVLCLIIAGVACVSVRADDNTAPVAAGTNTVMKPVNSKEAKAKAKADRDAAQAKAKADKAAAAAAAKQQADDKAAKAKAEQKEKALTKYPGQDLGLKPISGPALPISVSKQDQLKALLVKYEANEISPEEYHKQRADILSQP